MSEIRDMVVPLLQNIQAEQKALRARVDGIAENVVELKDEFDTIKGYITYQMGLTSQQQVQIEDIRKDIADLKRRMAAVETRS